MDLTSGLNLIAAAGAAVGAIGAWRAAAKSLESSRDAAAAAASLTGIEQERRHVELSPKFKVTLTEGWQGIPDNGQLEVELVGPTGLDYLDQVTIAVLNEAWVERLGKLPTGTTEEQAARFVWGPWEFSTGARVQIADERTSNPYRYSRVNGRNVQRLPLVRTRPGSWMTGTSPEDWRRQQPGPMRLLITCHRAPFEPWYVLRDIRCEDGSARTEPAGG